MPTTMTKIVTMTLMMTMDTWKYRLYVYGMSPFIYFFFCFLFILVYFRLFVFIWYFFALLRFQPVMIRWILRTCLVILAIRGLGVQRQCCYCRCRRCQRCRRHAISFILDLEYSQCTMLSSVYEYIMWLAAWFMHVSAGKWGFQMVAIDILLDS